MEQVGSLGAPRAVPVEVVTAVKKKVPVRVDLLGTVTPIASVAVKTRVDIQVKVARIMDSQSILEGGELVVTEKLYTDKADPNVLHDEITTIDHALTRPWTVTRSYRRDPRQTQPDWQEVLCKPDAGRVLVGDHYYRVRPEGLLMPAIKGQQPPDLKYFKTSR